MTWWNEGRRPFFATHSKFFTQNVNVIWPGCERELVKDKAVAQAFTQYFAQPATLDHTEHDRATETEPALLPKSTHRMSVNAPLF